jgi:hypothetical protein
MKKTLFIIATFCLLTTAHGQQFSYKMFFIDAAGNKDTITLGYDLLATDSIDSSFGEVNIIKQPLKTTLDVRITNEWENREFHYKPGTFHTKKQIISYDCKTFDYNHIQTIDIHTKHWPVTATWNNTIFNDVCRNGSVFTSNNPGGWWDVGSPSSLDRQELTASASVTFSSNIGGYFNGNYGYIKGNDTIPVFWQAIADLSILYTSVDELSSSENLLKVFPNPACESLSIQVPLQFGTVSGIAIFSSVGQMVLTTKKINNINIAQLAKGIYFVEVTNEKGKKLWTRSVKE